MRELIRTDLRRILKDKLFLVVMLICALFGITTPILNKLIYSVVGMMEIAEISVYTKDMLFASFSPSGNIGLIAPILLTAVICKDFSQGTVRNKLISGKTRTEVFMSMFISSSVVTVGVMLVHAMITLIFSLPFFSFQADKFDAGSLFYILLSILFEILVYIFISALVSFFAVLMKSSALAVVLYIGANFFFSIVGSATMIGVQFADPENKLLYGVLEFLNSINLFTSRVIGYGSSYEWKQLIYVLVPTVIGSALLVFFGNRIFGKKDLK